MVLSQDHVAALQSAPDPSAYGGVQVYQTNHMTIANDMDANRWSSKLVTDIRRGLAEQR